MSNALKVFLTLALTAMVMGGFARVAKAQDVFTVQNDDVYLGYNGQFNSGSTYINAVYHGKLSTGSYGLGGSYFGVSTVNIDLTSGGKCVFIADAAGVSGSGPGDIASFDFPNFIANYTSNFGGNGDFYGITLADSGSVLVAGWTASGTLETFNVGPGCTLTMGTSITTSGLNGGPIDGLAVASNGKFIALTYDDGSYSAVALHGANLGIVSGPHFSNCANTLGLQPTGVAIDPSSLYVYMDCFGGVTATIDAYNVNTPAQTVTNGPLNAAGGKAVYGSNTMALSPDGKILYIVGTFSGSVETAQVNGTSVEANSCRNASLPGYDSQWLYPGSINVGGGKAGGDGAVVAEAGYGYTANSYIEFLTSSGSEPDICVSPDKQGIDTNSEFALSAASYAK